MSMVIDGTNGLTFNNATTQNSGGKVLQVVNATYSTSTTTTSTTFVSTSFTATITPLFATSKILILSRVPYRNYGGGGAGSWLGGMSWYRGGSPVQTTANYEVGANSIIDNRGVSTQILLDFPATTSSTTYTLYIAANGGTFYITDASSGPIANVILMEISA